MHLRSRGRWISVNSRLGLQSDTEKRGEATWEEVGPKRQTLSFIVEDHFLFILCSMTKDVM